MESKESLSIVGCVLSCVHEPSDTSVLEHLAGSSTPRDQHAHVTLALCFSCAILKSSAVFGRLHTRPGVLTVATVQWGAVEKKPKQYDFSAYRAVCKLLKKYNLRLQVSSSPFIVWHVRHVTVSGIQPGLSPLNGRRYAFY